jgi:hypothetical protein
MKNCGRFEHENKSDEEKANHEVALANHLDPPKEIEKRPVIFGEDPWFFKSLLSSALIISLVIAFFVVDNPKNLNIKSITSDKSYSSKYSAQEIISTSKYRNYWCSYDNSPHQISISLEYPSLVKYISLASTYVGLSKDINVFVLPNQNSTISASHYAGRIELKATIQLQTFKLERKVKGQVVILEFQSLYAPSKYYTLSQLEFTGYGIC